MSDGWVDTPLLREKLAHIEQLFPLHPTFRQGQASKKDFVNHLAKASGAKLTARTWQRYLKENYRLPRICVHGLCQMYVGLRSEMLEAPAWEAFELGTQAQTQELLKQTAAALLYTCNRPAMAVGVRPYYSGVDTDPSFPLLYRRHWIPDRPILLTDETETLLLSFDEQATAEPAPRFLKFGDTFHELKMRISPEHLLRNDECYRLLRIDPSEHGPRLVFGLGTYHGYYDTCEVLGLELANYRREGWSGSELLPFRGAPSQAFDFENRSAAAGVNTLLILLDYPQLDARGKQVHARRTVFVWHRRGQTTDEAQNVIHVCPAGTFQPETSHDSFHRRDFSLRRVIMREFAEELLGVDKFELMNNGAVDYSRHSKLEPFSKLLLKERARSYFLGVGLDPVTLKPEVMSALVFRCKDLPDKSWRFRDNFEGNHGFADIAELREFSFRQDVLLPAGAGCMRLAAKHLQQLISE